MTWEVEHEIERPKNAKPRSAFALLLIILAIGIPSALAFLFFLLILC